MFKQTALILLAILLSSTAYAVDWCEHPSTELCLTFEEGSEPFTDNSQNDFTINEVGTVSFLTSSPPDIYSTYYVDFLGSDDAFSITDSGGVLDFEGSDEDFSVCLWINPDTITNPASYFIGMTDINDDFWRFIILDSTDKFWFSIDTIDTKSSTSASTGTWQHICFTADRDGNGQIWINGSTDGSAVALSSETMSLTDTEVRIGRYDDNTQDYNGKMDDIIIVSSLIDSTDINDMVDNGLDNPTSTDWCGDANNVACYLMEDDGNESNESSGGSTALTETGGDIPQDADSKFGSYSRDFEAGDTEYLVHADGNETDISGADANLTTCAWVKLESLAGGSQKFIVNKYNSSSGLRQYSMSIDLSNKLQAYLSDSSASQASGETYTADTALGTATWYHVCLVYDDINVSLYLDGSKDMSDVSKTDGIYNSSVDFRIGAFGSNTNYMDGLIDDVGIFDSALDSTEINDIMDNGLVQATSTRRIIMVN